MDILRETEDEYPLDPLIKQTIVKDSNFSGSA